jgi:hypothetical protein
MSELTPIWNNTDLAGATAPAPYAIPNNPNAKSLIINNQSRYWLIISQTQTNIKVDRVEPFSYLTLPFEGDLSLSVDTEKGKSSLAPDYQFVDFSAINGIVGYQKGSTQFSGASTVDISNASVGITATTVTVNNDGLSSPLTDGSGTIATANTSQTALAANATRKYLLFQNISDTDMFINFGAAATTGAGSLWIQGLGGSIVFEDFACPTDAVNVLCAVSGKAYTIKYV